MEEGLTCSTIVAGAIGIRSPKETNKTHNNSLILTTYIKIFSKWIIDLNVYANYKTYRKKKEKIFRIGHRVLKVLN